MHTMHKKVPAQAAIVLASTLAVACNLLLDNQAGSLAAPTDAATNSSSGEATSSGALPADASSSGSESSSSGEATSSSSGGPLLRGCTPVDESGLCRLDGITGVAQVAATEQGLYLLRTDSSSPALWFLTGNDEEVRVLEGPTAVVSSWEGDLALNKVYALVDDHVVACTSTLCNEIELDPGESVEQLHAAHGGKALLFSQRTVPEGRSSYLRVLPDNDLVARADPSPLATNSRGPVLVTSELIYLPAYDLEGFGTEFLVVSSALPGEWTAVAADDSFVYLAGRCPSAQICRMALEQDVSAPPSPLYTGNAAMSVTSMFVDRGVLFWTTVGSNETWRCEISNCDATASALGAAATSFTRSSTHVYFSAGEQVYRLQRALASAP